MVSNGFRRSGRKSLKSLTSNSTGHRLAFLEFCGRFRRHYLSIHPNTLPVSCSAVKARQARKNAEVLDAGFLLLLTSHLFYRFPGRVVVCSCLTFPKKPGRRELFQNDCPVTVAGLALVWLSPRVHSAKQFQKGGQVLGSGSGSSL